MSWLENTDIMFVCGELLSMEVDAVVCPITIDLDAYGRISKKVFTLGGAALGRDIASLKESLQPPALALGQSVSLECKPEFGIGDFKLLIFTALWAFHSEYTLNLFYKAYVNSFREAFKNRQRSLALPVMAYDGNLKACGLAIERVLHDLDLLKTSSEFSIENAFFVTTNRGHVDYLTKEVEPRL